MVGTLRHSHTCVCKGEHACRWTATQAQRGGSLLWRRKRSVHYPPPPSLSGNWGASNKQIVYVRARVWRGAPGRKKEGSIRGSPTPGGRSPCGDGGIQGNRLTAADTFMRACVRAYVSMQNGCIDPRKTKCPLRRCEMLLGVVGDSRDLRGALWFNKQEASPDESR